MCIRNKMNKHIHEFEIDIDKSPNHRKSEWERNRLHKIKVDYKNMLLTDKEQQKIKEIEKEMGRPLVWGYSNSKYESQAEFVQNDVNPPLIKEMMRVYKITPDVFSQPWYPTINLKVDFGPQFSYVYRGNPSFFFLFFFLLIFFFFFFFFFNFFFLQLIFFLN